MTSDQIKNEIGVTVKQLLFLALAVGAKLSFAAINVVTSTTDLAWAVKEIGGKHVQVSALLEGSENPHYVDAVPRFILRASNAKLVCSVGLDLEVGWLPKVLSKSGNVDVQPGGIGHCEVGKSIEVLEKISGPVDRSLGDVHPAGNPHFWISPTHFKQAGHLIRDKLIEVDPQNATAYLQGIKRFNSKMEAVEQANKQKLAPFAERMERIVLMEYHKEFSYFLKTYGLKSFGSIEEKPGVPPSAGRLAQVAISAKNTAVEFVLAADTAPRQTLKRFAEMSGIPVLIVPMSLKPEGGFSDYIEFQNHLVDQVVNILQKTTAARKQDGKAA